MFTTKMYTATAKPGIEEKKEISTFLHTHLERFRDSEEDIIKAIDFAVKEIPSFGGFVISSSDESGLTGVVVVNQTGMQGYIPENILVYIATHKEKRGMGIGKKLMQEAIKIANGNIALHVEPDNPARFLYEKLGFISKYLEMRLVKK